MLQRYLAQNNELAQLYYHSKELFEHAKAEAQSKNEQIPEMTLALLGQKETVAAREKFRIPREIIHPHRLQTPQERQRWFNERFGLMAHVIFTKHVLCMTCIFCRHSYRALTVSLRFSTLGLMLY